MKQAEFLLIHQPDRWTICRVAEGSDVQTTEVLAESDSLEPLVAAMTDLGWTGQSVCLGIDSRRVFVAAIQTGDLPRKQRHAAMTYRLEEQLPLEAERMTAEFLPLQTGTALGLAIETSPVGKMLDALAEAGIEIAAICPTALLAAWQVLQRTETTPRYIILAGTQWTDVLRIEGSSPAAWHCVQSDPQSVLQCLHVDLLTGPKPETHPAAWVLGDADEVALAALSEECSVQPSGHHDEVPHSAALAASELLNGQPAGWVNLRTGALAPVSPWGRLAGRVKAAKALAVILLIVLIGNFLWRGTAYQAISKDFDADQEAVYVEVYPNTPVPLDISGRLTSELRRLSAVSGAHSDVPDQADALATLRQVLAALPTDIRLRLLELRMAPGDVLLEGQARNHSDAEEIAAALTVAGVPFDPPRTERLAEGGASFTLTGHPPAPAPPGVRAAR